MSTRRTFNGALLGVRETAAFLGCSERALWRQIANGKMPARKFGGHVVFRRTELEQYLKDLPGLTLEQAKQNNHPKHFHR